METVVCAAIRIGDKIWRGHRHGHALQAMRDEMQWEHTQKEITAMTKEQGFMTTKNRYVSRSEGFELQKAAGIESVDPTGYREALGELFSEDLY